VLSETRTLSRPRYSLALPSLGMLGALRWKRMKACKGIRLGTARIFDFKRQQ
jgi:hypothetical protein